MADSPNNSFPNYSRERLPHLPWKNFRKKGLTSAVRIHRPFTVETREGVMSCPDGWLALDVNGDPYPIADDVMQRIYEEVK